MIGCVVPSRVKILKVRKVSVRLLAAVHLQYLQQSAAGRPISKRKSSDANDLGVDDKHVWGQEKILQCGVTSEVGLVRKFCQI